MQSQAAETQFVVRTTKSANGAGESSQQQRQAALWHQPQQPSIRDLDSLRTLLPQAHKHLLGNSEITICFKHLKYNRYLIPFSKLLIS